MLVSKTIRQVRQHLGNIKETLNRWLNLQR